MDKNQPLAGFCPALEKLKFIAHQKEEIDRTQKKRFRGIGTRFLLLTTQYVMFEGKKKTQILIAHKKEEIDRTQKSPAIRQKKFV